MARLLAAHRWRAHAGCRASSDDLSSWSGMQQLRILRSRRVAAASEAASEIFAEHLSQYYTCWDRRSFDISESALYQSFCFSSLSSFQEFLHFLLFHWLPFDLILKTLLGYHFAEDANEGPPITNKYSTCRNRLPNYVRITLLDLIGALSFSVDINRLRERKREWESFLSVIYAFQFFRSY